MKFFQYIVKLASASAIIADKTIDISKYIYISVAETTNNHDNRIIEWPPKKRRKFSSAKPIGTDILEAKRRLTRSMAKKGLKDSDPAQNDTLDQPHEEKPMANHCFTIQISKRPNFTPLVETNNFRTDIRSTRENESNKNQSQKHNNKSITRSKTRSMTKSQSQNDKPQVEEGNTPNIHENLSEKKSTKAIAQIEYSAGEIIWAKLGHWPAWPAKIDRIYGVPNQMIEIVWFNDYRRSKLHRANVFKFFKYFDQFSSAANSTIGLECAVKEAVILESSRRFETQY